MSSVLKRKKKPMEPLGYTKKEMILISSLSKEKRDREDIICESYLNLKLIAYQILHDKFGFGQKRITRVDNTIDAYLKSKAEGKVSADGMERFLKEKCDIDVSKEANMVPFREQFYLLCEKVEPASMRSAGIWLNASIINIFTLLGVCLKTQFKFSARQIREVYEHIRSYINTLSNYKRYELKIEDIAESVAEECKYFDRRFVGGTNGKQTQVIRVRRNDFIHSAKFR